MEQHGRDVTEQLNSLQFAANGWLFMKWSEPPGPEISDYPPITFFKLNQSSQPKSIAIDWNLPQPKQGIYSLEGDVLLICLDEGIGQDRPATFSARSGSELTLIILKRRG
jgi:uncharacterized protein (TIGR03067 family)